MIACSHPGFFVQGGNNMNENIVRAINEMQILRKCIESIAGDKQMVEQIMDKLEIDIKAKLEIPENLCWM